VKIVPSHDGHQTVRVVKGRRLKQTAHIFRVDYTEPANWPERSNMAERFKDQGEEAREAKKRAAFEKRLRKQRSRRGDILP